MLDLTNLDQIADGDSDLIDELIKTFLQTTREDIKHLAAAISHHRAKEISELAHRIKGGAAIVGAHQLYNLAENLEHSPKQRLTESNTALRDVQSSFQAIENLYPGL